MKALFPGSFDPFTMGHLDVVHESSRIFDDITIMVGENPLKTNCLFTQEERIAMIQKIFMGRTDIHVAGAKCLTVDFAERKDIHAIIRGLRLNLDYEEELKTALANKHLNPIVQSVYFMSKQEHLHISSSVVRSILTYHDLDMDLLIKRLHSLVPGAIVRPLVDKYCSLKDQKNA